ncbi:MAG: phosphatidate cytidylyltransferase [Bacteroidetes bacterium]|nr:MAG: phosphatidate cytidylyltransferase [Bacteroidota bacterium]
MSNLVVRSLTGGVFVAILLGSIFWNEIAATGVLSVFFLLGINEFNSLFKGHEQISLNSSVNMLFGVSIFTLLILALFNVIPSVFSLAIIPFMFIMNATELWRKEKNPIQNMAVSTFGLIYLIIPFFLMIYLNYTDQLRHGEETFFPLLAGFFLLVWTNDTFAYLTGMMIGKHKLFERISPKKTWEGTIGGAIFTILVGYIISLCTVQDDTILWVIAGVVIAPFATIGDLLESQIKRSLGIKDSGNILPGHGGILDRFDAALFAIPIFATWTYIFYNFYN